MEWLQIRVDVFELTLFAIVVLVLAGWVLWLAWVWLVKKLLGASK